MISMWTEFLTSFAGMDQSTDSSQCGLRNADCGIEHQEVSSAIRIPQSEISKLYVNVRKFLSWYLVDQQTEQEAGP